jgi:hypothetical protein
VTRPQPAVGLIPDTGALPVVQSIAHASVQHPEAPLALIAIVLLFLLFQHRIDRRDPKLRVLVSGPLDELEFGTAIGRA